MRLWKQKHKQQSAAEPEIERPSYSAPGDPMLPGSAGYRGTERLKKNAMPVSRFNFKRPDGKP